VEAGPRRKAPEVLLHVKRESGGGTIHFAYGGVLLVSFGSLGFLRSNVSRHFYE
jgi:hypothetical protein